MLGMKATNNDLNGPRTLSISYRSGQLLIWRLFESSSQERPRLNDQSTNQRRVNHQNTQRMVIRSWSFVTLEVPLSKPIKRTSPTMEHIKPNQDLHLYFYFHTLDRQISSSDNVIYNNPFIYIPLLQEATSIMNRIFKYIYIYICLYTYIIVYIYNIYIYITARSKGCLMNFKKLRFLRGA